jgi:uncharacterized circularly permuted ATP-grasp superfamily protein/uncharacterized alpha-E superfamily protein
MVGNDRPTVTRWHEILDTQGYTRSQYSTLLAALRSYPRPYLRELEQRLHTSLRELGITFGSSILNRANTWFSDLLPHLFGPEEWDLITRGFQQRVRAFELLLHDVYGKREILREGLLPIPVILGSPQFQRSAVGLRPASGHYLHLNGLCLCRDPDGRLMVKHHYFSHPSGISYMIQDRRLLARVVPELFELHPVEPMADVPTEILLRLRSMAPISEPSVVLLTPGLASAVYSEHSFLARRMGIPLVQGGDLLVLNDLLFLKTVSGLEKIDVVYSRVADPWLDPLVFKSDSRIGVPGLIHCLRKGTVALVNSVGSQLADDRSLLHFSNTIIRYYLGEWPILPTTQTYWLGDMDQCELVLEHAEAFQIRTLTGERFFSIHDLESSSEELRGLIRKTPHHFVAQPREDAAKTISLVKNREVERLQDHIVYGMRNNDRLNLFPGALTRISAKPEGRTESEFGGGGKDTWVLRPPTQTESVPHLFHPAQVLSSRRVTSRVAEAFYWLGRYLERTQEVARIIQFVETVELEELNAVERKLYRPIWNHLLPPLDQPGKRGRRGISNVKERYRLLLEPDQTGSVASMIRMAWANASSLREAISPEAWSVLSELQGRFGRKRLQPRISDTDARRLTRRLAQSVLSLVPQFIAVAQQTMLADDGWRFCELGLYLERAVGTANATYVVARSIQQRAGTRQGLDIVLSAFLRLLACRDAYRRIYQARSEPASVFGFLWQNSEMPRSVMFCLQQCAKLLAASLPASSSNAESGLTYLHGIIRQLRRIDWYAFFVSDPEDAEQVVQSDELVALIGNLLDQIQELHQVITDHLLSHQRIISEPEPTLFNW